MEKHIIFECPTCGAKENQPCRTPKGRKKINLHNNRPFGVMLVDRRVEAEFEQKRQERAVFVKQLKEKALASLGELPSVCQGIGTAAAMARRCNMNSRLGKKRWDMHAALFRQANDLMHDIRVALVELI